jgi:hypothetical protein
VTGGERARTERHFTLPQAANLQDRELSVITGEVV